MWVCLSKLCGSHSITNAEKLNGILIKLFVIVHPKALNCLTVVAQKMENFKEWEEEPAVF